VSELASLCEGETLMVGGKELEVMGLISAEDYARGRCFQEAHVEKEEAGPKPGPPPARRLASKPFCSPLLGRVEKAGTGPQEELPCRPRHDPLTAGGNRGHGEKHVPSNITHHHTCTNWRDNVRLVGLKSFWKTVPESGISDIGCGCMNRWVNNTIVQLSLLCFFSVCVCVCV